MNLQEVVGTVITALPILIPVGQFLYQFLLEKLPSSQRGVLEDIAGTVVTAVEQIGESQSMTGDAKKSLAVDSINKLAKQFGLSRYASPVVVEMLVESLVLGLNQAQASAGVPDSVPPAGVLPN